MLTDSPTISLNVSIITGFSNVTLFFDKIQLSTEITWVRSAGVLCSEMEFWKGSEVLKSLKASVLYMNCLVLQGRPNRASVLQTHSPWPTVMLDAFPPVTANLEGKSFVSIVLGGNKLWLGSASCCLSRLPTVSNDQVLASHRLQDDWGKVLGEMRHHTGCKMTEGRCWGRWECVSCICFPPINWCLCSCKRCHLSSFFFRKAVLSYLMLRFCHTALNTEAQEGEISWKIVPVSCYAWHFHTDKVQLNIDFLVKFELGVWSVSIDCEPLSLFSTCHWVLLQTQKGQRGKTVA